MKKENLKLKRSFTPLNSAKSNLTGFTLIELLVIIAIIGLLASIVLISVKGAKGRAYIAKGLQFDQSVFSALGSEAAGIWDFDEGTGTSMVDSSGNGNNGACSGANCPAWLSSVNTPNKRGSALNFDGIDDFVYANNVTQLNNLTNITISVWINPNMLGGTNYIVQRGSGAWNLPLEFFIAPDSYFISACRKMVVLRIINSSPSDYRYFCTNESPVAGNWNHIAATINETKAALYINGKVVGSFSGTDSQGNNFSGMRGLTAGGTTYYRRVNIGAFFYSSETPGGVFNGSIDEVRLYTQPLSIGRIQKLYAEGLEKHQNLTIK